MALFLKKIYTIAAINTGKSQGPGPLTFQGKPESIYIRLYYMRYLARFLQVVFTVYAFIPFTAFLLLIFPIVVVASFFGKIRGGNFIYKLCRAWSDFVLFMLGIFHRTGFEVPHDPARQYVFVFNHISFLDIPVLIKSIRNQPIRILGKAEMAKIPLFGFIYRNAVVLVERDNPEKRAKSVKQLKSVLQKGISIVISPEGTFNMTHKPLKEFYDGAFRIAIETQTPIKPILFLDTYDRMHYSSIFSLNPGRSRAVYLAEVAVEGLTVNDVAFLKEKVYRIMEEGLIKYKASWITDDTGNTN
jgi:1-acyl-sn-glycerol-3-phosphate acyltransferase